MRKLFNSGLGMAIAFSISTAPGMATMITGNVSTTGGAAVSGTSINFYNGGNPCSTPNGVGADGCFVVGTGTGDFLATGGTLGNVRDVFGGSPTGPRVPTLVGFMTFTGGLAFDLVNLPAAGLPGCSTVNPTQGGVTCVPDAAGPSAFRLTNGPGSGPNGSGTATSVGIQFTVGLNGYLGTSASGFTPYIGIFTTQVAGMNAQDVLNALAANGGTGSFFGTYSGNFTPASSIPEPGTILLMGIGLIAVSVRSRKFVKR